MVKDIPIACASSSGVEQTISTWRKRFGAFEADAVRQLKQLEAENARLQQLVVEASRSR